MRCLMNRVVMEGSPGLLTPVVNPAGVIEEQDGPVFTINTTHPPLLGSAIVGSKWDRRFLDLAKLISTWSKDPSTQTGAVIVGPEKSVISVGFNGFASGMKDDPVLYEDRNEKLSRIIHCEMNALLFAGRPIPCGSTLYTYPFMSCDRCVVHMLQAGIYDFVAPVATGDRAERWKEAFNRTRLYIEECQALLTEVDYL